MADRLNAPAIPGMRTTLEQVLEARERPAGRRTPKPREGQHVWYRHDAFGPPEAATILEIEENEEDPSTHRYVVHDASTGPVQDDSGRFLRELVADPWWSVVLRVDASGLRVQTREARIEDSPGWLPMSEEN
jgi:hypothetical protein